MALETDETPYQDLDARVKATGKHALEPWLPSVLANMGKANPRTPGSGGSELLPFSPCRLARELSQY